MFDMGLLTWAELWTFWYQHRIANAIRGLSRVNQLRACVMRPERSRGIQISGSDMSSATPAPIQAFWWKSFCLSGRRTLRSSSCCQCVLRDMQRTPRTSMPVYPSQC